MIDNIETLTRETEIKRLIALRKKDLSTDFIDAEETNEDGDKIKTRPVRGPAGTPDETEINLTRLYQPTPSTTGDVSLLVLEAEMLAEGRSVENPHVPVDTETLERAQEQIEQAGNTPAWEQ